jgi:hypothetical protein
VLASLAAAALLAFPAADGGSGTYIVTGHSVDVLLYNSGTTAWRGFALTAPAGTIFVGGTTGNESSALCTLDATRTAIQCGPIGPTVMPPQGHLTFGATMTTPVPCDETFQLSVSADGATYTHAADVAAADDCARALTQPVLHRVGRTIRVTPPAWSSPPSAVVYRWQLCRRTCRTIAGATSRRLVVERRFRGSAVRVVVSARIGADSVETASRRLAVR